MVDPISSSDADKVTQEVRARQRSLTTAFTRTQRELREELDAAVEDPNLLSDSSDKIPAATDVSLERLDGLEEHCDVQMPIRSRSRIPDNPLYRLYPYLDDRAAQSALRLAYDSRQGQWLIWSDDRDAIISGPFRTRVEAERRIRSLVSQSDVT